MIYKKLIIGVGCVLFLMSGNGFAGGGSGVYGGIQYASFDFSSDDSPEDFSPTGLVGRVGSDINKNFSELNFE